MEVKDLAGLSDPIKKLINTVSKGIGAIFEPYLIRKKGEANIDVIQKLSDVIKRNPEINTMEYIQEGLSVSLGISERANTREQYKNIKKQKNIEKIISQSVIELETDSNISNEEVNDDWVTRYCNIIEDVSDELMQQIWAKVLAGELRKPGSYSLRTLEVLRNLSRDEANLFNKIASYALNIDNSVCILNINRLLELSKELTYAEIIILKDLGLLSTSDASLNVELDDTNNGKIIINGNKIIIIEKNPEVSLRFSLQVLPFSKIGKELLAFTETTANTEYISGLCSLIKTSANAKIYIADIKERAGNIISYENRKEIHK